MPRTWCTTLEETIVSEYVDNILNKKKKKRPPKSPYALPGRPPVRLPPTLLSRPVSRDKRPKTACTVKKCGSDSSLKGGRRSPSPYRSGSLGSITSLSSSQLSVYSTQLQGSPPRNFTSPPRNFSPQRNFANKKLIKRVKVFVGTNDEYKVIVASSYSDLLERAHEHHLYTSDGTPLTPNIYSILPPSCHLFVNDPISRTVNKHAKPKIVWTKEGIMVSGAQPKRITKPHLSTRMMRLVETKKPRVQILKNGEHRGAGAQVRDSNLLNMLDDATKLLLFTVSNFYTVEGIKLVEDDPVPHVISSSHVKGPLWATKGNDNFSFLGSYNWCKAQLKTLRAEQSLYQDELTKAYLEDASEDKISSLQSKADTTQDTIRSLRETLVNISDDVFDEEDEGAKFRVRNMPSIDDNSRLIGRLNIKTNVYVNGKNIAPKVVVIPGGTFKPTMDWFLDECERAHRDSLGPSTQKATQLYTSDGSIIKNMFNIESEQTIYLSYGEAFSTPKIRHFLNITYFGVTAYDFPDDDSNLLVRRPLEDDEVQDSAKYFSTTSGIPSSYRLSDALLKLKQKNLHLSVNDMAPKQIFDDHVFLQHRKIKQRLIYPSLVCNERSSGTGSGLAASSQTWMYTKNFELRPKSLPKMCLSVSEHSVTVQQGEDTIEGFMVILAKGSYQSWHATTSGQFVCARTGLYLTCLDDPAKLFVLSGHQSGSSDMFIRRDVSHSETDGDTSVDVYGVSSEERVQIPRIPQGEEALIVALPLLKNVESQRWAFKQENISLLGQWKLCDINNPEWAKECLSWPTNQDGSTNTKLSWPMEGLLLAGAPNIKQRRSSSRSKAPCPVRLSVRNNGSIDAPCFVTAPDLTNMKKDLAIKIRSINYQPDTEKWLDKHSKEVTQEDKEKVSELEFRLFLDKCQTVLGLCTPPTRLFTSSGEEVVSLDSLERDAEVYVSCGADFESPDGEKLARNKLLYDISHDVNKIKTFCSVMAPSTYIVGVCDIKRNVSARLQILTECESGLLNDSDSMSNILQIAGDNKSIEDKQPEQPKIVVDDQAFHLKSHTEQNEGDLTMLEEFPWRNPAFISGIVKNKVDWESLNGSADSESDCDSVKSVKSSSSVSSLKSNHKGQCFNQWIYKECRFFLLDDPHYVLSTDVDNSVHIVLYDKNSPEQCWTIDEEFVYSSNGQVLTVTECSVSPPGPVDYVGARLKVAPFQAVSNGNANQKWKYDHVTGNLIAFAGTDICKCISTAMLTKICTYAVTSSENIEQPTYIMENPGLPGIPEENTHIYVCASCATALRDRYSIDKIDTTTFVCSVGYYCSSAGLSLKASFLALGGLDGLEPGKAFGTLYLWESVLSDLKQQTSLKAIRDVVKETLQLECPNESLVLVRCYQNGAGPPKHNGVLFLAQSLDELFRKAQVELKSGRPLTRLFLADGTEMLNFQNIVEDGSETSTEMSASDPQTVPYKELFVSAGEGFVRPKKNRCVMSIKKRVKIYNELNKLDVASLMSVQRPPGSRPPHLPHGKTKQTLPVFISRNGDFRSPAVRVVAYNLESVMEIATGRLNLPVAARKVFTADGREVSSWHDLERDQSVVISTGEPFILRNNARKKNKWVQRKLNEA